MNKSCSRTQRIIIDLQIDLFKRDFIELPAGTPAESFDVAALRGFAQKASETVDSTKEAFDIIEVVVRVYEEMDNFTAPAIAARKALIKAEQRLFNAHARYGAAMDAHSTFVNARVGAASRLGATDNSRKATIVVDEEEELVIPKFLERKLPEPSEGWKDSAGKLHRAHLSSAAFC